MILVIVALKIIGKFQKPQSLSSSTKGLDSTQVPLRPWSSLLLLVPTLLLQKGAPLLFGTPLEGSRSGVSQGGLPPSQPEVLSRC